MRLLRRIGVSAVALLWLGVAAAVTGWAQGASSCSVDGAGSGVGVVTGAGTAKGKGAGRFPSYLDDSFSQLKEEVPALRRMTFDTGQAGQGADESVLILNQTGEAITAMMPRVPHLIAKEELLQVAVPLPYVVDEGSQNVSTGGGRRGGAVTGYSPSQRGLEGNELWIAVTSILYSKGHTATFGYRIQSDKDEKYGLVLNEYRTNGRDERISVSSAGGSPHGVGFGNSWMMFEPENAKALRFRYLGRQKVGKRDTFVVAYAQVDGKINLPGEISISGVTCHYLTQGVLWIDQSIFQIVRLQTDLLAPVEELHLSRLRSELTFSEIRIPERNLSLWMPKDVMLSWQTKDQVALELHRYSNYKLFTATSRIILP